MNASGNLFKGGQAPDQNGVPVDGARLATFWAAKDIQAISGIVDLPGSVTEWAGDALLNNGDGYYGGSHNFYIYDQGQAGYVWLPADTDSTFDWLTFNSPFVANDHPICWWEGRGDLGPNGPGQHDLAVINDPTWRQRYVDAIAAQLTGWDVSQMQAWVDQWSEQIAQAVQDDPHPAVHPGAPEVCGNEIDDDCNGVVDDGCGGPDAGAPDGGAHP